MAAPQAVPAATDGPPSTEPHQSWLSLTPGYLWVSPAFPLSSPALLLIAFSALPPPALPFCVDFPEIYLLPSLLSVCLSLNPRTVLGSAGVVWEGSWQEAEHLWVNV